MCGRFILSKPADEIADDLNVTDWPEREAWLPGFNIAPTRDTPVLLAGPRPAIRLFRWGLVPFWAKELSIGNRLINARAETLEEKPSFRHLVDRRRCGVIAEGYFEWRREGTSKTPWFIHLPDRGLMIMAGLWDVWHSPDGSHLHSYTIVTTTPSKDVARIHNRMPVILPPSRIDAWIDPTTPRKEALCCLVPSPCSLSSYRVSTYVNNAGNDGPVCIEPDSLFPDLP